MSQSISQFSPNMVTSKQFQTRFGEYFDLVKSKTPVAVTQYGRPTVLMMSYADGIEAYRLLSQKRALEILQSLKPADDVPTQDELDKMIDDERANM
ncbi:type II toxin-antitoxin system prevent-host-death family antitoxin [Rodentibacter genomosp. 2]|uniref:Antitoxin n=1 Tax=Rodentibacter genomosp. 2 TaxID=1908266 RepID=A0A1V3JL05_9PAST|nr:type II toxin-antitoxin system prevent-host-death family antitoxin [Rodentibacter genomosp. 2]OOF57516.1 hypothetical protein BKK55_04455 [Rodentibacter genomosp. 2]